MNKVRIQILDTHVAHLCTYFSRQSDRTMLNIKPFRNGISSVSRLSAKEKVSRLLAILLTLLTSDFEKEVIGKKARKNSHPSIISKEEYNSSIKVFEETLCFTMWANHNHHPKVFFKGGRKSVVGKRLCEFVEFYKKIGQRNEGMGLKILKFHQILHLWWIIRLFASLLNVDSGRNESHHKKKKDIASHTQRRIELFDFQTSSQQYRYDLLLKAMKLAQIPIADLFEMNLSKKFEIPSSRIQNSDDVDNADNIKKNLVKGSKVLLTFDYTNHMITAKWLSDKTPDKNCDYPGDILPSLYSKLKGFNGGKVGFRIKTIMCFTETKLIDESNNEFMVRACPNYRKERDWFDWALVDWGADKYGKLEAQILLLLDMISVVYERYELDNNTIGMDVPHIGIRSTMF